MKRWMLSAVLLAAFPQALAGGARNEGDFYVATRGSDAGTGTSERPFATIARARDAVRERIAAGLKADVTVLIRGGTYFLAEPLAFGLKDSGTEQHSITYAASPGERVVVSGGRRITGWTRGDGELWTAQVPGVKEGKWYPRQLFVDGRRAARARTPNLGGEHPFWRLAGATLSKDKRDYKLTFPPGLLKAWTNPADIEVVIIGDWEIVRKRLESIDAAAGIVTLAPPHIRNHPNILPKRGLACHFENAPEMLDRPGEWYLDRRTGTLACWPLPGEDMTRAEAVAPVLTRLLEMTGQPDKPVRNVHFRGIRFEHTEWPLPKLGYFGVQACVHDLRDRSEIAAAYSRKHDKAVERDGDRGYRTRVGAAIRWEFAHECSLTDGAVAHTGGGAMSLRKGCCRNVVEGNAVLDVGGNGIMVGETMNFQYYNNPAYVVPPAEVPRGNRVANNHIRRCGAVYHGGVGIWLAFTDGTVVSHNLVHDLPYTGISVGWMWRPEPPTVCRNNIIEFNHIHDVMKLLADGGCIYTLGFQPGTVLRGNLLHDVHYSSVARQSTRSNNGIFLDNGSKGILLDGNVVYNTAGPPWRINTSNSKHDYMTWRNNHFMASGPKLGPGRIGKGLLCDGRNYIDAPHSPALEPDHLTVEAWIRLTDWPVPKKLGSGKVDARRWIVGKSGNEWAQGHYGLVIRHDRVGAYLNIGGGRENSHSAWGPEGALKLNRWYHLAMTYDGSDLKAYLDGAPAASTAINKKREPGKGALNIGRRQDGYVYFKGSIDEVRIYNRALSADELKAHATKPDDAKTDKSLVGHWAFDEPPDADDAIKEALKAAGIEAPHRARLLRGSATDRTAP